MSASAPTTPTAQATTGSTASSAATSRLIPISAAVATAIVIVAVALLPFLTPLWIFPGQARAQADAWTGWPIETVNAVTGEVLVDLIVGPPDFDQAVDGDPVFNERERGHLRDVRTVLIAFAVAAAVAGAVLAVAWWIARGGTAAWRGVRSGAKVVAVGVVALGVFAVVAFDTAFALFHTVLFPEGSYTFDPTTERLVQLFPESFWYETAIAIGVAILALSIVTLVLAGRRIRRIELAATVASAPATADMALP